jgi:hypothetical protein
LPQEALERALRAAAPMAMVATDGGAAELLAARSDAVRVSGDREAHSRTMAHPLRGASLHCMRCVFACSHTRRLRVEHRGTRRERPQRAPDRVFTET